MFDDIPIDLRHHPVTSKPKFPASWYMTAERTAELAEFRARTAALDGALAETGRIADGIESVRAELGITPEDSQTARRLLAGKVYKRLPLAVKKKR